METAQIREPIPGTESEETLNVQIFRMTCLGTACMSLFLMLPVYAAQNLKVGCLVGVAALGFAALACYLASSRGRHWFVLFLFILLASIDFSWPLDGGTKGGLAFYFLPVLLYPMTIFRGIKRWALSSLVLLNLVGLMVLDRFFPDYSSTFPNAGTQLFNRIAGGVCSSAIVAAMIWSILRSYEAERDRLEAARRLILLKNADLHEALSNVKQLKGLLPICCGCKKIRDDGNYWHQVESYLSTHSDATFSHGYCPSCMEKYFPGIASDSPEGSA
jgi:hypothetical protein